MLWSMGLYEKHFVIAGSPDHAQINQYFVRDLARRFPGIGYTVKSSLAI